MCLITTFECAFGQQVCKGKRHQHNRVSGRLRSTGESVYGGPSGNYSGCESEINIKFFFQEIGSPGVQCRTGESQNPAVAALSNETSSHQKPRIDRNQK